MHELKRFKVNSNSEICRSSQKMTNDMRDLSWLNYLEYMANVDNDVGS